MKALIDADWFAYAFGNATDDEFKPLAWPFVKSRIDGTIRKIVEATGSEEYQLFLTSSDKSNFRFSIATIKPYKGNRPTDKPHYYDKIRDYLSKGKGAIIVSDMEADDQVSIELYRDYLFAADCFDHDEMISVEGRCETVLCTIDKDLDNTPGLHYNWMKEDDGVYWVGPTQALRSFYRQLLTGDTVDNIPGLFGVGKASKLLQRVSDCDEEQDMYNIVQVEYEKRFGSYFFQFLAENAQLLYMIRIGNREDLQNEVKERLDVLELKRQDQIRSESKED